MSQSQTIQPIRVQQPFMKVQWQVLSKELSQKQELIHRFIQEIEQKNSTIMKIRKENEELS